jgi:predicted nucleic acid-binding protein
MTGKLLDTTVLVDLSRGSEEAADFVDSAFASDAPLFISVISANDRHFKMIPGLEVKRPY